MRKKEGRGGEGRKTGEERGQEREDRRGGEKKAGEGRRGERRTGEGRRERRGEGEEKGGERNLTINKDVLTRFLRDSVEECNLEKKEYAMRPQTRNISYLNWAGPKAVSYLSFALV